MSRPWKPLHVYRNLDAKESFLEDCPHLVLADDQDDESLLPAPAVIVTLKVVKIRDVRNHATSRIMYEGSKEWQEIKDRNLDLFVERHNKGLDIWSGEIRNDE